MVAGAAPMASMSSLISDSKTFSIHQQVVNSSRTIELFLRLEIRSLYLRNREGKKTKTGGRKKANRARRIVC